MRTVHKLPLGYRWASHIEVEYHLNTAPMDGAVWIEVGPEQYDLAVPNVI